MMTLEESIAHAEQKAAELADTCPECAEDHAQLAAWLTELKGWREMTRYPITHCGDSAQRALRRQSGHGHRLAPHVRLLSPQAQEDLWRVLQSFESEVSSLRRKVRNFRPF
jgi:hypothetical protein